MNIAKTLQKQIRDSGESQSQLAIKINVSKSIICRFLQGRDVRLDVAEKLSKYFNLELKPK